MSFTPPTHKAGFLAASFMLFLTGVLHCCSAEAIYVKPTPTTPCWQTPCQTLSHYLHPPISFSAVTEIVFLPGTHTLDSDINIATHANFTITGNTTSLPQIVSTIVCSDMHWITFSGVILLKINAIEFQACGTNIGFGTVLLFSVEYSEFKNVSFQHNIDSAIFVLSSTLYIADSHFRNNSAVSDGGAIRIIHSTVMFSGTNYFTDNNSSGGAIAAANSTVMFSGANYFSNNFNHDGGVIAVINCTVVFSGTNRFTNNSYYYGGVIGAVNTTVMFSGTNYFTNNSAVSNGGGTIEVVSGTIMFSGTNSFTNNSKGGVIGALNATVMLSGTNYFTNNSAVFAGGALRVINSTVMFSGTNHFTNNSAKETGGAIYSSGCKLDFVGYNVFVGNTAEDAGGIKCTSSTLNMSGTVIFTDNSAIIDGKATVNSTDQGFSIGGAIGGDNSILFLFNITNIVFSRNKADYGSIVHCSLCVLHFHGNQTFMENKSYYAGMAILSSILNLTGYTEFINNYASLLAAGLYAENSTVTVTGTCIFRENNADQQGGAIYLDTTMLHLQGNVTLQKNSAHQGGGLFLARNSRLQFGSNLQLIATENSADYGGAIYIKDEISFTECFEDEQNSIEAISCFFPDFPMPSAADFLNNYFGECPQDRENVLPPGPPDCALKFPMGDKSEIKLVFEHNSASKAGSILFGGKLDRCTENASTTTFSLFTELAVLITNDTITSVISSEPLLICPCVSGIPHCESRTSYTSVIPGEAFQLSAVAVGQGNGSIPTTIRSYFELHNETAEIGDGEHTQTTGKQCTDIMYTIFSSQNSETLFLYPDGPCRDVGIAKHTVHVSILPCPHAFELMSSMCTCEKRIRSFTNSCNVSDNTIQRSDGSIFWLALSRNESNHYEGVILHPHCPLDYCKTGSVRINLSDTSSQCAFNRSGMLCGSCRQNLSAVFGSSQCLPCSNAYLGLIIPFAIAGFVLVFFILTCKMTVAVGTVNGLIFYANIVSNNRHIFIPHGDTNILAIFIAWLNLDIGIETCFYDGMDVYTKTWLQFVFPLYVWGIIGLIIFISKYSPRITRLLGRNPVAVLATLFLLSYAKILRALIVAFSVAFLEYPDESKVAVWLYDGNISYLHEKHIPLFATSLLMLFVFLPYTFLLVFSQWLQVKSHKRILSWMNSTKFRAFIDAYHAPYKPKYRYWTGLLLIVRCALFITFALNFRGDSSTNLLSIVTVSSVLAVIPWLKGRVYNSWCLNALEVSFFLNLSILSVATYHVRLTGGNQAAVTYTSISVTFILFIGVLIYHSYTQLRESRIWRLCIKEQQRVPIETAHERYRQPESATVSVLNFTELREPLMGDRHLITS